MTDDTWTVKRVLEWIEGYLEQHDDENPRVSAQWLVSEALGVSRMQLFLDAERPLSPDERATLRDWTRRRANGEPLQYITGETAFRHITVKVRAGVLIPRPETEVLVSEALALLPAPRKPQDDFDDAIIQRFAELEASMRAGAESIVDDSGASGNSNDPATESNGAATSLTSNAAPIHIDPAVESEGTAASSGSVGTLLVADICTGTGCIACSIASEHPDTRVVATDLSPIAVELARENVDALGLSERIEVVECDLASGIDGSLTGTFDLVVSNPPYIPSEVLDSLPSEVGDFEPELALDGGADGLDVFRDLLDWCTMALKPDAAFAFELHETRLEAAAAEAGAAGFTDIRIIDDLAGKPRVLVGRKRS